MGRSRLLRPEFFLHEALAELSPLHRLLFAGLWTLADKAGRLEDRPKRIKAQILPWDACDVDEILGDLDACGPIDRYEGEDGKRYISISSFLKHQKPHPREANSVIPPPSEKQAQPRRGSAVERHSKTRPLPGVSVSESTSETVSVRSTYLSADADARVPLVSELQGLWNEIVQKPSWTDGVKSREKAAKARLREKPDLGYWRIVIERIAASSFCRGGGKDHWVASPDFLVQPDTHAKVLEGKYDDRGPPAKRLDKFMGHDPPEARKSFEEIMAQVEAEKARQTQ